MARFSLCLDLVSFDKPNGWDLLGLGLTTAGLTASDNADVRIIFRAASYEYPDSVRLRDVGHVIREHFGSFEPAGPVAADTVVTWAAPNPAESSWKRLIFWRTRQRGQYFAIARILEPDHIRVFSGLLSAPGGGGDRTGFEARFPAARETLAQAVFASERNPFDGIATSADMQMVNVGNFFFQLQKDWKLFFDEDGRCTARFEGPVGAILNISATTYDCPAETPADKVAGFLVGEYAESIREEWGAPVIEGDATDAVTSIAMFNGDFDPPSPQVVSHRVVRHGGTMYVAQFFLQIPEPRASMESGRECFAFIKREIASAVFVPDPDPIDP